MARPSTRVQTGLLLVFVGVVLSGVLFAPPAAAGASDDVENVTVYRISALSELDRASFDRALANQSLHPTERVVIGDTLVVAIESDRLANSLESTNESTTAGFFDALDRNATLRMEQTNPSPQRQPMVAALGPENVSVERNGSTTYVFVNTSSLRFTFEDSQSAGLADVYGGERFAVAFGYDVPENPDHDYLESVPEVEFFPARAAFYDGGTYRPLPPERIDLPLRIHVPPTTSLEARLSLPENRTITVAGPSNETGIEDVSMDLRNVAAGTPYTLELRYEGTVVDRYEGTVREPKATLSTVELTTVGNQAAVKLRANLSHGGSVIAMNRHCENLATEDVSVGTETPVALTLYDRDGEMIPADRIDTLPVVVRSQRGMLARSPVYDGSDSFATFNTNVTCPAGLDSDPGTVRTTTEPTPTTSTKSSPTTDSTTSTTGSPTSTTVGSGGTGTDGAGQDTTTTTVPGFTAPLLFMSLLGALGIHLRRL